MTSAARPRGSGARDAISEIPSQEKYDEDDENDSQDAARSVAPAAAVRPGRYGTQQQEHEQDQEDQTHRNILLPTTHRVSVRDACQEPQWRPRERTARGIAPTRA